MSDDFMSRLIGAIVGPDDDHDRRDRDDVRDDIFAVAQSKIGRREAKIAKLEARIDRLEDEISRLTAFNYPIG